MRIVMTLLATLIFTASISAQDPNYIIRVSSDTPVVAGSPAEAICSVTNTGGDIQGFSLGICSDPAVVEPVGYMILPALQAFNGGTGPGFFAAGIHPDGFACGTALDLFGVEVLGNVMDVPLVSVQYDTFPNMLTSTPLDLCDTVGNPAVVTGVVIMGNTVTPTQVDGAIEFVDGPTFVRGDSNGDNVINIADPITTLNHLFQNGPALCLVAMDANGDGAVDIADPLAVLQYINGQGPAPTAPFPNCGVDTTGSTLECVTPPSC